MSHISRRPTLLELRRVLYGYAWGNNSKRVTLKGRKCRIVASGTMNSCLVEFIDSGQREVVSRRALRRMKA